MNYLFPKIECIDDVLPAIQGYDEFRVIKKEDYIVINYAVSFEKTWDITDGYAYLRRECRGLIFDKEGNLISRPYQKFFNANERPETNINKINLYEPHVILEKLDGSMIRPISTELGFRLATKAGITNVAMNAEKFIADKPYYSKFIIYCINNSITPIFEWVSRTNRIIVDYPQDNLILTAMRYNKSGIYETYEITKSIGAYYNIPVVKAVRNLSTQNINLLLKQVREWNSGEGIVIRFDNGHMVKIKSDDYVLKHKTKDQISLEKNVIQVILDDAVDDLLVLLSPQDSKRLKDFQVLFWNNVNKFSQKMDELFLVGQNNYPDKKNFAINFVQKLNFPNYAPIMYGMKDGKTSKELILDLIGKSLSSQNKIDKNRWLWGNIEWNKL